VAEELAQRYGYPISGSRSCACCAVRGSAIRPERAKRRRRRHSARRRSAKVQPAATVRDLTLTSWSGVRILDLRDGKVSQLGPPTFRDQFIRILPGPRCSDKRVVAISLFGRVQMAEVTLPDRGPARVQYPAEPIVFRGSTGIPQFSRDGQRLLIVSGGMVNVLDSMRLIDVTPLCRTQEPIPKEFRNKPAPVWLADLASAVSALDTTGQGSSLTLEIVKERYPKSKIGHSYEAVWNRFFPSESAPLQR
jgi:hypothetical protein